ncbi:14104_t:CDS:2 [Racocetra fulgida]|uniref:14104_t:CDS:1 n=1 Tax=Racocetra fulgida TaxID=60492 RepID=A0A9N8VZ86_9GLOM|nr:14104_t:CDS:2 [Racocetra fulgida]
MQLTKIAQPQELDEIWSLPPEYSGEEYSDKEQSPIEIKQTLKLS